MRIVLFGCKDTTLQVATFLRRSNIDIDLVTIPPALAEKNEVAGYLDLVRHPDLFKSIYVAKSYSLMSDIDAEFFENRQDLKLGFCIGWQRLIPGHVLKKFQVGVHGMHGSARDLPFGKGRSPMNWSLIEGRKFFITNLFKYLDGVDNGPVVDKSVFSINDCDTSETLHYKNTLSMCHIIENNIEKLLHGKVAYVEQQASEGDSFYPKRSPADGAIDWRDDIYNIDRLIRAVAPPFYGALGFLNGSELKIQRASVFYSDLELHPFRKSSFGEILEVFPNGKFLVRCSGGALIVHEFSGPPVSVGDVFDRRDSPYTRFSRNVYGFYDVDS